MKYAIKRHDGKIFPETYETREAAQNELNHKLGNGASHGLAWIVEIDNKLNPNLQAFIETL